MKKKNSLLASVLFGALAVGSLSGCMKDDFDEGTIFYNVVANANAANERQATPVNSPATGTLTGRYNVNTNVLNYTVTWRNLTATVSGMHFHGPATPQENAGVAVAITPSTTNATGSTIGTATLTDAQEADMMAGKWYLNIHTSNYPAGEIRGQLSVTP